MKRNDQRRGTGPRAGQYDKPMRCDGCGRTVTRADVDAGRFASDTEVCGGTDGPGFILCDRDDCWPTRLEGKTVEERRAIYTATRARLAAKGLGRW